MEINRSLNAGDELENNGYGSDESEDAGFDAMTDDTDSLITIKETVPSRKCKKKQATVKQKSGRNHGGRALRYDRYVKSFE